MMLFVGGRGFLASHARQALTNRKLTLVSSSPPLRPALGPNEHWLAPSSFAGAEGDETLRAAQAVVYFASASVPGQLAHGVPQEIEANLAPAAALLERLDRLGSHARFVFLSSGGTVYGPRLVEDPISEAHPLAPISAYGLGKTLIEEVVQFYGRTRERSFAVLRVANPVGLYAHSTAQGLVPAALRAARSQAPLRVYGDGLAARDYLAASDVARAIALAVDARAYPNAIWNIGSGRGATILDMLALVGEAIGRPVPFEFAPARSVDVPRVVLDCRRAESELGWRAQTDLRDVVRQMWADHENAGEP